MYLVDEMHSRGNIPHPIHSNVLPNQGRAPINRNLKTRNGHYFQPHEPTVQNYLPEPTKEVRTKVPVAWHAAA